MGRKYIERFKCNKCKKVVNEDITSIYPSKLDSPASEPGWICFDMNGKSFALCAVCRDALGFEPEE